MSLSFRRALAVVGLMTGLTLGFVYPLPLPAAGHHARASNARALVAPVSYRPSALIQARFVAAE